ncbi:MAG: peptidoglycan-binding protein [Verrucomicrobia bacterium]|nr:peptidoglycan-binding protein [Verrucomicrobiota bacterium]
MITPLRPECLLSPEAEAAIDLARSLREALSGDDSLSETLKRLEGDGTRSPMRALDPAARDLIIGFETGGRAYYQKKLTRPNWPGFFSGVTIGFGYDLRSDDAARLAQAWGTILTPEPLGRLSAGCGLRGEKDTERIKEILGTVQDIVIPWEAAERVFLDQTLPRYRKLLLDHLPEIATAPPKCEGALLSLVFNRGAVFREEGDRFAEMREIRGLAETGQWEGIPARIRSMKRLWPQSPAPYGLQGRREAEALLFEEGLRERTSVVTALPLEPPPRPDPLAVAPSPGPTGSDISERSLPAPTDLSAPVSNVPTAPAAPPVPPAFPPVPAPAKWPEDAAPVAFRALPEAGSLTRNMPEGAEESTEPGEGDLALDRFMDGARGVMDFTQARASSYWPSRDETSTEYAHLATLGAPDSFELTPEAIEVLIAANRFDPEREQSIFALGIRGSFLTSDGHEAERRDRISLTETRPDHVHFKCTVGFYHRAEGKITLYAGSTVPCPYYMRNYHLRMTGKAHQTKEGCNLMPCGCYLSRVGTHSKGTIDPAVRTTDPVNPLADAWVTVLRSSSDVGFGTHDHWDRTQPYDNIHCSYYLNESPKHEAFFSSAGCTTVRGRKDSSTDQFGKFQKTLLQIGKGRRIDYLLLTGKEYALAAESLRPGGSGTPASSLTRLRTGSMGEEVRRLQQKLGFVGSGYFGASTKKALAEYQRSHGVTSDGIYSPDLDVKFQWNVFHLQTAGTLA